MKTVFELIGNDSLNMELSHFDKVISKFHRVKVLEKEMTIVNFSVIIGCHL